MKRINWARSAVTLSALLLGSVALAVTEAPEDSDLTTELTAGPESVDSFHFFGRLDSWRAIDRDTLIVWATPFRPYLIELRRPSVGLRFAEVIGISSTVGRVHRRLDEIYVDGWPYQIETIHRLTPSQARNWGRM